MFELERLKGFHLQYLFAMTVVDPTFPSCDCLDDKNPTLNGEARVNVTVRPDDDGGALAIDPHLDSISSFEHLECVECGHVFIEDGEIVDERVSGTEV